MYRKEIFYKDKKELTKPLTHITGGITDPGLKVIDELYGAADELSIENAKQHKRILKLLAFMGALLTFGFLLYDEMELHGLILACLIMFLSLFLIRRIANCLDCHRKYIEYRVLAEALRLQFFLSVAGVKTTVAELLPWFIKQSLPWINSILETLPKMQSPEKDFIANFWILDQKSYHSAALVKAEDDKRKDNIAAYIVLIITLIAYIATLLFEVYVYSKYAGNVDANGVRAILKILVGTMSAVTLFTESYYGKMSLTYTINDHKRMIALYEDVESKITPNRENEEILVYLAREFLIENSAWYSYQTKNKPDLVF